jgi:hypothetical protein
VFLEVILLAVGYTSEKLGLSSKFLNLVRSRKTLSAVASEETYGKPLVQEKVSET